ncbi:MAG: radical SAM protein [Candidatus Omnitrophica bacterium]|nr:radical SAM protein [Candidatus Omnitrophota bacterium]
MAKSGILSTRENNRIKVHYAWIYVTERCNLHCDYCFFRHKGLKDISLQAVNRFFSLFKYHQTEPSTLILSGGEPFLAKDLLYQILEKAKRFLKKTSLHIQTNGVLIDKKDIKYLKSLKVSLEFGIDGYFDVTTRHRRGLKPDTFNRLTDNIKECMKADLACGTTMTVHPREASRIREGVTFLKDLGFPHMDVTPAAFMTWDKDAQACFKRNYLAILKNKDLRSLMYAQEDKEMIRPGDMDLSLHPPGHLLAGDPFLCLPENKRQEFSIWDIKTGQIRQEVLSFYQEAYKRLYNGRPYLTYREFVMHHFKLVNKMMGYAYLNAGAINNILKFLQRAHVKICIKNDQ